MSTQATAKNGKAARRNDGPQQEPKPPFPRQHQKKPGLEDEMKPRPRYGGPRYRGGEAGGENRSDHRRRQRNRPGGGESICS